MIRFLKFFFILFVNIPIYAQSEYIYILGNTQDAGMPHIGCKHKFCEDNFSKYEEFYVTSIAVINSDLNKYILFEATPDITYQLFFCLQRQMHPILYTTAFALWLSVGITARTVRTGQ